MKCSLSREETLEAWNFEKNGASRIAAALKFHVSERTLPRLYECYGFGSPKRKKKVKK